MKGLLVFFAKRYIAGDERKDAINVVRHLNALGILATIDHLGENVTEPSHAEDAVKEYLRLLDDI